MSRNSFGIQEPLTNSDLRSELLQNTATVAESLNLLDLFGKGSGKLGRPPESTGEQKLDFESIAFAGHRDCKRDIPDAKADLSKTIPAESSLKDGDIIFQSNSAFDEGKAIQIVSKSPLTHCGVLFKEGKEWFVYEAVQPVTKTPLKDFVKTANGETYAVRRLRDEEPLTPDALKKMKEYMESNVGKDYDHKFGWGNDKMYCSELVWKAYYEATRLKVGKVKMVGDFDLTDPLVKRLVEERYGKNVPTSEPTITPGDVFNSRRLKTIK